MVHQKARLLNLICTYNLLLMNLNNEMRAKMVYLIENIFQGNELDLPSISYWLMIDVGSKTALKGALPYRFMITDIIQKLEINYPLGKDIQNPNENISKEEPNRMPPNLLQNTKRVDSQFKKAFRKGNIFQNLDPQVKEKFQPIIIFLSQNCSAFSKQPTQYP